jgi:hypothetical protein
VGILGTSLGSCVAFIAAAHDPRVRVGIFNHVSMYFSDVVWTGLSTQNVRQGFSGNVSQDDLRRYWSVISPASYLDRLKSRHLKSLLVWASHDSTFLPVYSQQVLKYFREFNLPHQVFTALRVLYHRPVPFNLMDGAMCRFAARNCNVLLHLVVKVLVPLCCKGYHSMRNHIDRMQARANMWASLKRRWSEKWMVVA